MAFILNTVTKIRNNWKKSLFLAGALYYAGDYLHDKYKINELMREYCIEAAKYGDITSSLMVPSKKIIVILNPTANRRKSQKTFEKYCEPMLHLAGISIEIVKTDSEGHARRYTEDLKTLPDAILIAGGDGTLSEAVTGLLRRSENEICPIGILPVGRTNLVGRSFFFDPSSNSRVDEVRGLAKSAISVVRGKTEKKDVMKIEVMPDYGDVPGKPIFAIGSLEWGAFRDALSLRDQYWYTGPLREYFSILRNAFGNKITWNCDAKISYTPPCDGCSNCFQKFESKQIAHNNRWWSKFLPRAKPTVSNNNEPDFSKIINDNCKETIDLEISPSELILVTNNLASNTTVANENKLQVLLGTENISSLDFIPKNWSRISNNYKYNEKNETINVRTIQILPKSIHTEENEIFYSIDNEAYEVKPIKISLIPKAINMYTL